MYLLTILLVSLAPLAALGQSQQTCTAEMMLDDDCIAVVDANACYNKFRWNAQTLTCIDGKDNADKQRKVCLQMLQLRRHRDVQLDQVAEVFLRNKLEPQAVSTPRVIVSVVILLGALVDKGGVGKSKTTDHNQQPEHGLVDSLQRKRDYYYEDPSPLPDVWTFSITYD
ncbi:hypothetical protein F4808DRAFT_463998 [Astrocystis sublimbata]|nr:hypothetical protein F4808DRAFT_463998 [Astrocystis sublimbata]